MPPWCRGRLLHRAVERAVVPPWPPPSSFSSSAGDPRCHGRARGARRLRVNGDGLTDARAGVHRLRGKAGAIADVAGGARAWHEGLRRRGGVQAPREGRRHPSQVPPPVRMERSQLRQGIQGHFCLSGSCSLTSQVAKQLFNGASVPRTKFTAQRVLETISRSSVCSAQNNVLRLSCRQKNPSLY